MGRPKGSKNKRPLIKLPQDHQLKTRLVHQANKIAELIEKHLRGEREMTAIDATLAKLVFGKVVPDLRASENTHISKRPVAVVTGVVRGEAKPEQRDIAQHAPESPSDTKGLH